jgi:hypothetical protein
MQSKVLMNYNMILIQIQSFYSANINTYLYDEYLDKCILSSKVCILTSFLQR